MDHVARRPTNEWLALTYRDKLRYYTLYGTTEGILKGWETRRRGGGPAEPEKSEKAEKKDEPDNTWKAKTISTPPEGTGHSIRAVNNDVHVPQKAIEAKIQAIRNDPEISDFERENADALGKGLAIVDEVMKNGDSIAAHTVDGKMTPERMALREKIIEHILSIDGDGNPIPKPGPNTKKEAIFLGGPSGGGKGTLKSRMDARGKVTIDADEIKKKLLEADGLPLSLAAFVHEESSEIAKEVLAMAIAEGRPFIFDGTLKSVGKPGQNKALGMLTKARDAGFDNEVLTVQAAVTDKAKRPGTQSTSERVARRFIEQEKRKPGSGRLVPPEVAREHHDEEYGTQTRRTYEALRKAGLIKRGRVVDTSGKPGEEVEIDSFGYDDEK